MDNKRVKKRINEKSVLLLKAKKSEDEKDINMAHKKRNYVNRLMERSKKKYYKEMLEQNIRNSKNCKRIVTTKK